MWNFWIEKHLFVCVCWGERNYIPNYVFCPILDSWVPVPSLVWKLLKSLIVVSSQSVSPHHRTEWLYLRNAVRKGLLLNHLNINTLTDCVCCKIVMVPLFTALTKQSWSRQKMHQSDSTHPSSKAHVVSPLRQGTNNTSRKARPAQGDLKSTLKNFERKFPSVFNHMMKTRIWNTFLMYCGVIFVMLWGVNMQP